uniref:Uncharacterized protein n=1 Tax=Faecalibaculum rodentium TaxID=1702221 RepID=A0A140DUB1_9FIRM|nr:hypothetical protein AALO17_11040 [Faecalibaculum rodentium]
MAQTFAVSNRPEVRRFPTPVTPDPGIRTSGSRRRFLCCRNRTR